ncbi:hypothetical protein D3C73_397440 [compost metagenome]
MHIRIGQRLILEGRIGEMPGQLSATSYQRGGRIRVWNGDGVLVEAIEFLVTPLFGGGVLQEARLHRNTYGRHGDAVLFGEVGDGFDRRIITHQVVRKVAQGRHGFDVLLAVGAIPDGQQRTDAGTGNVDRAGKQRIIDRRAARKLRPVDLDVDAFLLAVLLDQVLIAHHVEQQVDDAELFGDADFTFGVGHGRRHQAAGDQAETQADGGGQRCKGKTFGHGQISGKSERRVALDGGAIQLAA